MKRFLAKQARRVAPRTVANMRTLSTLDKQFDTGPARFLSYERELRTLRREIDELRRDNRRVAELYDAVFQWVRTTALVNETAPTVDPTASIQSISAELATDDVEMTDGGPPAAANDGDSDGSDGSNSDRGDDGGHPELDG